MLAWYEIIVPILVFLVFLALACSRCYFELQDLYKTNEKERIKK